MQKMANQATGLARLFSGLPASVNTTSVLSAPHGGDSSKLVLGLADALSAHHGRVCLVQARYSKLSVALGCRPMHSWQCDRLLDEQIIHVSGYHLLHAPDCMAGDAEIIGAVAKCGRYDFLLFDGGRFTRDEAQVNPQAQQTLVILMGRQDVETVYALFKGLCLESSPTEMLLLGEGGEHLTQLSQRLPDTRLGNCKISTNLYRNGNNQTETSSNTLTINPNLSWIVSRIQSKNDKRMANGGVGKSSEEINQG